MWIFEPGCYKHCALEYKAISVRRKAESIQQPLERIACQQEIEDLTALAREIQQSCSN